MQCIIKFCSISMANKKYGYSQQETESNLLLLEKLKKWSIEYFPMAPKLLKNSR